MDWSTHLSTQGFLCPLIFLLFYVFWNMSSNSSFRKELRMINFLSPFTFRKVFCLPIWVLTGGANNFRFKVFCLRILKICSVIFHHPVLIGRRLAIRFPGPLLVCFLSTWLFPVCNILSFILMMQYMTLTVFFVLFCFYISTLGPALSQALYIL